MKRPKWLTQLFQNGEAAYSSVASQKDRRLLSELQSLQLTRVEVHKTRRKILVTEQLQFSRWVEAKFPDTMLDIEQMGIRAQNIAERRDSKSGRSTHSTQPLILKWFDTAESPTDYGRLTQQHGIVGVTSERIPSMLFPRRWWLLTVENWESFYRLTYPASTTTLVAIYLKGNVSDIVLQTLSSLRPLPEKILHFGDFDWTGLSIFNRIQAEMPAARLYIPPNIEYLFKQHGNRRLIEKQTPCLESQDKGVQRIIQLISQYNCGVEQEITKISFKKTQLTHAIHKTLISETVSDDYPSTT